jgi:thiosulfate/3-mercaptopyruvate sulfurtransferase
MTLLILSALLISAHAPAAYARPELLAEPTDLTKPDAAKRFVCLDVRPRDKYRAGHVPGALWVDAKAWAAAFDDGADLEGWQKRIGGLGLALDRPVVIYDEGARGAAGPIDKGDVEPTPREVKLTPKKDRLMTKQDLLGRIRDGGQVVDARSTGEFCGTESTAKRNGAVPGAKHLEWSDTLDKTTGRFKTAAELTTLFKEAGVDPSKPSVTYCQSGGRASVMAFVLELMGGGDVRNYYKSWAEWGNDSETPIEKPKK